MSPPPPTPPTPRGWGYLDFLFLKEAYVYVGCILMKFGFSMGGGDWAYFAKKAPNLAQIGCFSAENGILKGPKIMFF